MPIDHNFDDPLTKVLPLKKFDSHVIRYKGDWPSPLALVLYLILINMKASSLL